MKKEIKIGDRFGKLTITSSGKPYVSKGKIKDYMHDCICSCGNKIIGYKYRLVGGKSTQCKSCAMLNNPSKTISTGDVFGDLSVIGSEDKKTYKLYLCKCKCGKILKMRGTYLRIGRAKRCKNCATKLTWQTKGINTPVLRMYKMYKKGATNRELSFEITKEDFTKIVSKNCNYCDAPPRKTFYCEQTEYQNGIDRINNKKGYTVSNCVPCCTECNKLKSNMDIKTFKQQISKIFNHYIYES